jgi:subtilisin
MQKYRWLFGFMVVVTVVVGGGMPMLQAKSFASLPLEAQGYSLPEALLSQTQMDTLVSKAEMLGSVRLIVGVKASFLPEGYLSGSQAVDEQRLAISKAQNDILSALADNQVQVNYQYESIPYLALDVDAVALKFLNASPEVFSIQEDIPVPPTLAESVPLIGGNAAWASGYTGAGETVAILDTGVDKMHPFLSGKVVSEACYSTTNSGYLSTSVCPGGAASSTASGSGLNCSVNGCDHGTHVAGIAAGKGTTFSGVAKEAKIIAIQVFSRFDNVTYCISSPCVLSFTSDQIAGLQRVYALRTTYHIAAVNMSLGSGGYFSSLECDSANSAQKAAIDQLRSVGIATVISAGNDASTSTISAPGCISSAISVGSTTDGGSGATPVDTVSYFSNVASIMSLFAPGQVIYSSLPGGAYGLMNGTSMAAPHVTGAWAVMKSRNYTASVSEILTSFINTGITVTDARVGNMGVSKPRIRLDLALSQITVNVPPPTVTPVSRIDLPMVFKQPPSPTPTLTPTPIPQASVYVDNQTGGQVCYEVTGSGIGQKCFSASGESFYGAFRENTYNWTASGWCGSGSGSKYYKGVIVHTFVCSGPQNTLSEMPSAISGH